MKTLIASLFVALTLSTAAAGFAATTEGPDGKAAAKSAFRAAIYPSAEKMKLNVVIEKEKGHKVLVRLINDQGYTILIHKTDKNEAISHTRFDMNQLQDGKYRVEVSDGATIQTKVVDLSTRTPTYETYRTVSMK